MFDVFRLWLRERKEYQLALVGAGITKVGPGVNRDDFPFVEEGPEGKLIRVYTVHDSWFPLTISDIANDFESFGLQPLGFKATIEYLGRLPLEFSKMFIIGNMKMEMGIYCPQSLALCLERGPDGGTLSRGHDRNEAPRGATILVVEKEAGAWQKYREKVESDELYASMQRTLENIRLEKKQ